MNSLVISFIASICAASSSFFFRKNCSKSLNPSGYLVFFYFCCLALSLTVVSEMNAPDIDFIFLAIGSLVGLLNSSLMILTSKALKTGPAGLTYSFQNASAIFPGIILFMFLGNSFGFSFTFLQFFGLLFVILGLFSGARKEFLHSAKTTWLFYALACFAVQILALTLIQARCLLFECEKLGTLFSNLSFSEKSDVWFMPGQFGASFMMQLFFFLRSENKVKTHEMLLGFCGGLANFSSTLLLLLATKLALPFEKGILFPCFAVSTMVLCNLWANKIYSEKFNFKTNTLCSIGIFMASAG